MENTNQDAMLNEQSQTYSPDGGPMQTTGQSEMPGNDYNSTDLSGDAYKMPATPTGEEDASSETRGSGAASGSPNMKLDINNYGNGDSLGNNDGTEPDPEMADPML